MATITIVTTEEEQQQVLDAIKKLQGQTVAVSKIAQVAGMNQNRVRYVLTDLLDSGRVVRLPTKAFNKHYVRYRYEVAQES